MKGLTDKQRNILEFISDFMEANVMAPTVYEIAEHFNIKTSTVFAHLRSLQKKNYLKRSSKARSISLSKPRRKSRCPNGLRSVPLLEKLDDLSIIRKKAFCDPRRSRFHECFGHPQRRYCDSEEIVRQPQKRRYRADQGQRSSRTQDLSSGGCRPRGTCSVFRRLYHGPRIEIGTSDPGSPRRAPEIVVTV